MKIISVYLCLPQGFPILTYCSQGPTFSESLSQGQRTRRNINFLRFWLIFFCPVELRNSANILRRFSLCLNVLHISNLPLKPQVLAQRPPSFCVHKKEMSHSQLQTSQLTPERYSRCRILLTLIIFISCFLL